MSVETVMKIALPPLEFEEFNALDVLVNAEIADLAFQVRLGGLPVMGTSLQRGIVLLERLRAVRSKIDRARPSGYAAAIRAARAETVCDT